MMSIEIFSSSCCASKKSTRSFNKLMLLAVAGALLSGCGGGGSNIGDADMRSSTGTTTIEETTIIRGVASSVTSPAETGEAQFDPAPGNFSGGLEVQISVPEGATNIRVTTDGEAPTDDCRNFSVDSRVVNIDANAVINVRYDLNEKVYENTANYSIASVGSAATNKELARDWMDYEEELRQELFCKYYSCQRPSVAQGAKRLGLPSTIEDGVGGSMTQTNFQLGSSLTPDTMCGKIAIVITEYKDYEYNGMKVSGTHMGCYKPDGTGTTDTYLDDVMVVTGSKYSGTIFVDTKSTENIVNDGTYHVTCSGAGCGEGAVEVMLPNFTVAGESNSLSDVLSCD